MLKKAQEESKKGRKSNSIFPFLFSNFPQLKISMKSGKLISTINILESLYVEYND